jgi:cytochrome c oxidase assembly factor CtaG
VPAAWEAALSHPELHDVEHMSLAVAGIAVWWVILDPARRRRPSPGRRAAVAAGLLAAGMVLGEVLVAAGPLYPTYAEQSTRLLGLGPEEDQQRAGLVMMAEQVLTFGVAAALLAYAHAERVGRLLLPRDGASE